MESGNRKGGILWIVSAPSGAGKTSLSRALVETTPGIYTSISYTTRQPRPGESEGSDYHFVSPETFADMSRRGEFLESAQVHGNRYGTGESWVRNHLAEGKDCLLEIDWQGADLVRQRLPEATVSIFILPPSRAVLEERLRGRGQDSEEVIARRLAAAREELLHYEEFDYLVVNADFTTALRDLQSIVRAEHLRRFRQQNAEQARLKALMA